MSYTISLSRLSDGEDWYSQNKPYSQREIDAINDGQGGNRPLLQASIPSPFARIDLVRTAFSQLNERTDLSGDLNDQRLVSACFDIGQLFFHIDNFKDRLELIEWDRENAINTLLASDSEGHQHLGNALKLYLEQDKKSGSSTNFEQMTSLFMLRDINQSVILGGTSPSTLFFNAPEDLSHLQYNFGNYRLFQSAVQDLCPLHLRNDPQYQKFWYGFLQQQGFANDFPEIYEYLVKSLNLLRQKDNELWKQIGNDAERLKKDNYNALFENLGSVNVLGYKIKKAKPDIKLLATSDFVLPSKKYQRLNPDKPVPMVLQNNYQGHLRYTRDPWDRNQEVNPYVVEDWQRNERKLPGQAEYYPYLTVSDLLEPYIIRLVYPINRSQFYEIEIDPSYGEQTKSYLLPLSPTFFKFFDVKDLYAANEIVQVIMEPRGGDNVEVTIKFHLKANEPAIELSRIYYGLTEQGKSQQPDLVNNKGTVVECQVAVNLMPFIQFQNNIPYYNVQLLDRDIKADTIKRDYSLEFRDKDNQKLVADRDKGLSSPRIRSKKASKKATSVTTTYQSVHKNFDYIILKANPEIRGIIIPRFDLAPVDNGVKDFIIAVDFGTTNTHIELIDNNDKIPSPLTFSEQEALFATLMDPLFPQKDSSLNNSGASVLVDAVWVEWLPETHRTTFPTRTALLENIPDWNQNLYAFQDFNPALLYEKRVLPRENYKLTTNLKWANYDLTNEENSKSRQRIIGFIESLIILIRNKVLLNQGRLSATKLIWFYPLSMSARRRDFLTEEWNTLFEKYISGETVPLKIPESTAPYYWYEYTKQVFATDYPSVNIDIGGGTTDVVVFESNRSSSKPVMISSFRFAANAIFGDGFAGQDFHEANEPPNNGFVRRYKDKIVNLITIDDDEDENSDKEDDSINLPKAFNDIYNLGVSSDIVAFFFSLKANPDVNKKEKTIDFNKMLAQDDAMSVIFLTFYAALIYHVARLMQARDLEMPRYLTFSGNGAKAITILSANSNMKVQTIIVSEIFSKVYGKEYHSDGIEVKISLEKPKEITCKGGITYSLSRKIDFKNKKTDFKNEDQETDEVDDLKVVLIGTHLADPADKPQLVTSQEGYTYQDISKNQAIIDSVNKEVHSFVNLLVSLGNNPVLRNKLGIKGKDLDLSKSCILNKSKQHIKTGFLDLEREAESTTRIEETLFFFPIIQGLNALAATIANPDSQH